MSEHTYMTEEFARRVQAVLYDVEHRQGIGLYEQVMLTAAETSFQHGWYRLAWSRIQHYRRALAMRIEDPETYQAVTRSLEGQRTRSL